MKGTNLICDPVMYEDTDG